MSNKDHENTSIDDHVPHEEEHEEHIDERWLVSYADMMTLLFGLFVLLYSMATMDKNQAEKVVQSTQEKFGDGKEILTEKTIDYKEMYESLREQQKTLENDLKTYQDKSKEAEEIKKSLDIYSQQIEVLKNEKSKILDQIKEKDQKLDQLKTEVVANKDKDNKSKSYLEAIDTLTAKNKIQIEDLDKLNKKIKMSEEQMAALIEENKKLKKITQVNQKDVPTEEQWLKKIRDLESKVVAVEGEKKKLVVSKSDTEKKISNLQEELKRLQKSSQMSERSVASEEQLLKQVRSLESRALAAEESKKELIAKSTQNEDAFKKLEVIKKDLEDKLKKYELEKSSGSAAKAFLAVFINWSTRDHDIDLVVKDPNGKKFDFKNRKHGGYPGNFALDTRRGPGAELWQSDKIIPGKYTATYSFYNQYGNTEDAKVSGTIYTAKGSFEIKTVQMNLGDKREFHIQFEVAEDGDVKVINTRH